MTLKDDERQNLVALYREKALETLSEADAAIEKEKWSMAANRLYYMLFHAVTALLVRDGISVGSHDGAKTKFGQHYVKTGLVSADQGRLYSQLESLRSRADYDCFFKATKTDIDEYYSLSVQLFDRLMELLA